MHFNYQWPRSNHNAINHWIKVRRCEHWRSNVAEPLYTIGGKWNPRIIISEVNIQVKRSGKWVAIKIAHSREWKCWAVLANKSAEKQTVYSDGQWHWEIHEEVGIIWDNSFPLLVSITGSREREQFQVLRYRPWEVNQILIMICLDFELRNKKLLCTSDVNL